ncbi:MAG TPA: HAMP domain-containing sensor histidine kinase [Acidimicrobiales bacterium]|jgi:signal transduction histidine kinase
MTAVTAAVLIVAGVPLVLVVDRLARAEASTVLRRQAETIATELATDIAAGTPVTTRRLLGYVPPGDRLILETPQGTRVVAGLPPVGGSLAVDVEAIGGVHLRLETTSRDVDRRITSAMWTLAFVAIGALAITAGLAVVLSQRLADPLDRLAASAARLGAGDFSSRAPRSGISEADTIAESLDTAAARIASLVQAEREFSANASHQLRTAITGLRLRIESLAVSLEGSEADEATAALEQIDRLTGTLDDLLHLARTGRYAEAVEFDLAALVRLHVEMIRPAAEAADRPLHLISTGPARARAAEGALGQAIDVLIDNARRHGRGAITVTVSSAGSHASVAVADEGRVSEDQAIALFSSAASPDGHGIGLRLARTLVEADGGRLDLVSANPTTFNLTVPSPGFTTD